MINYILRLYIVLEKVYFFKVKKGLINERYFNHIIFEFRKHFLHIYCIVFFLIIYLLYILNEKFKHKFLWIQSRFLQNSISYFCYIGTCYYKEQIYKSGRPSPPLSLSLVSNVLLKIKNSNEWINMDLI